MAVFHPFPRLPTELRQMIWALAAEARVVPIRCQKGPHTLKEKPASWDTILYCFSPAKLPAVLHTCAESRSYLFESGYTKSYARGLHPRYVVVNFTRDIIQYNFHDPGYSVFSDHDPLIHHLGIEFEDCDEYFQWHQLTTVQFKPAKSITLFLTLVTIDEDFSDCHHIVEHAAWLYEGGVNRPAICRIVDKTGDEINFENYRRREIEKARSKGFHDYLPESE